MFSQDVAELLQGRGERVIRQEGVAQLLQASSTYFNKMAQIHARSNCQNTDMPGLLTLIHTLHRC